MSYDAQLTATQTGRENVSGENVPGNSLGLREYPVQKRPVDVPMSTQNYKSPCAAIMIVASLVNTQTHIQLLAGCTVLKLTNQRVAKKLSESFHKRLSNGVYPDTSQERHSEATNSDKLITVQNMTTVYNI